MREGNAGVVACADEFPDDHAARPTNRRMKEGCGSTRLRSGARNLEYERIVSKGRGPTRERRRLNVRSRDQRLIAVRRAPRREWRPGGRLDWGVPAGRWGRVATHAIVGPSTSASAEQTGLRLRGLRPLRSNRPDGLMEPGNTVPHLEESGTWRRSGGPVRRPWNVRRHRVGEGVEAA
jgi:hypothetical protein